MISRHSAADPTSRHLGDSSDPLEGTPYCAIGLLGCGAMGEVLEAEHRGLHKRVVVKLLRVEFGNDPRFADRLRVEAQALAAVSSPHVVSVTDLGQTPAGRPYLVMERLHGRTLREELELRGPLPVGEAIGITRQVLAGLAAAHRLGIIHRDVKLDNVFLCVPGELGASIVKVLDFGIAKVLHQPASPPSLTAPRYPTELGTLVGSPRTVSPEQARFQQVDARTDVYAVGLLLYTLVAGQGPFEHTEDVLTLLTAHICQAPAPPSRLAWQTIPPDLDQAILKALAKRPEHRFQTAELFANELARIEGLLPGATLAVQGGAAPALRQGQGSATQRLHAGAASPAAPPPARTTAQGTVVLRFPAGGGGDPASDPEAGAWPVAPSGEAPIVEVPANLPQAAPAPEGARLFVVLVVVSTVIFSLIAAEVIRYLEAR
jgi:serine/threonine-protein kinase